jgi:hypothetical protein
METSQEPRENLPDLEPRQPQISFAPGTKLEVLPGGELSFASDAPIYATLRGIRIVPPGTDGVPARLAMPGS